MKKVSLKKLTKNEAKNVKGGIGNYTQPKPHPKAHK